MFNKTPSFVVDYNEQLLKKGVTNFCYETPNVLELNVLRTMVFQLFLFWIGKYIFLFLNKKYRKKTLVTFPEIKIMNKVIFKKEKDVELLLEISKFFQILIEMKILLIAFEYLF